MNPSSPRLLRATSLIVGFSLAPAVAMAEEPMTLRFAWPDDLSGRATLTLRHTSQRNTGSTTEWEGRGSVRFSVSPVAGDLLMTFEDSAIDIVANTDEGVQIPLSDIFLSRSLRRPNYRISRDGAFLGLDRPGEFLRSARSDIKTLVAQIPQDMREILQPVIEDAMSQEQFEYHAENRWREEVGIWVDRQVGPGDPDAVAEEIDLLIGNDHAAPGRASYRLVGRVPCGGSSDETCVELERRAIADTPAATAAYARMLRGRGNETEIGQFEFATTTRLITDPDTLLPYQVSIEWVQTIDLPSNPASYPDRQSGVATVTYDYD